MKINLCYILLVYILGFSQSIHGQSVSGKITNQYNQEIIGANIVNIKSDKHTHSNEKGEFIIESVAVGDTLQITYIGFESELIELKKFR